MNRPKLAGLLSAAFGSTAGFLVLSRWHLAGTITGAVLMPVIFTIASFGSHETMERATKWFRRRVKRDPAVDTTEAQDDVVKTEPAKVEAEERGTHAVPGWRARAAQWSVVAIAFLAFGVSIYSLTQENPSDVTILRERVVETVTVTTERPSYSVARTGIANDASDADVAAADTDQQATTTTAEVQTVATDTQTTTVSTEPEPEPDVTTTSLP